MHELDFLTGNSDKNENSLQGFPHSQSEVFMLRKKKFIKDSSLAEKARKFLAILIAKAPQESFRARSLIRETYIPLPFIKIFKFQIKITFIKRFIKLLNFLL